MEGIRSGLDPDAAVGLAVDLDRAGAEIADVDRRVASVLGSVGVGGVDGGLSATAVWCEASARDLRRRAAVIAIGNWIADATSAWPSFLRVGATTAGGGLARGLFFAASGSGSGIGQDPAEHFVVLLAGGGVPEWMAREYPQLAVARQEGQRLARAVSEAKARLALDFQQGRISWSEAAKRQHDLERLEARASLQGRPTVAGVGEILSRLSPGDRRQFALAVADWVQSVDLAAMPDYERAYLRNVLDPVRDVVAGQTQSLARDVWMDPGRASSSAVDEMTEARAALEIDEPETTSPAVALVDGLVRGSFNGDGYGGSAGVAFAAGHFISGLVVVGDVRDLVGDLARRDWTAAGLDAIGIVPFAGDVVKGARAAEAAGDAANAARRGADAAESAADGARISDNAADARDGSRRLVDDQGRPTRNLADLTDPEDGLPEASLEAHEGVGAHAGSRGGHSIEEHVSKSHDALRARQRIKGGPASTFDDLATANRAVDNAIRLRAKEIRDWLESGEWDKRLVVTVEDDVGDVLDTAGQIIRSNKVFLYLKRDTSFKHGWRVHTSYVNP